ncbi:MAG: beta-CASP ribonuclease aCPSF1, partial [Candidatus Thermoplasmatota archaeon]
MTSDEFLHEAKKIVRATIPENIVITDVELEGPMVVVYTKNLDVFTDNKELIRELVQSIKRRVTIRPDASTLMDEDRARTEITHIIPPEAEVTDIYFWEETGEVTIEALSPGAAIGKQGTVLNEIKKRIGWSPRVIRTPPIPSKTIEEVRGYLRMVRDERKAWLKKVGRRINRLIEKEVEWVRITSLGGYREIGRSATLLTTKHSKVIVDCGVRFSNEDGSPYLNIPEVLPIDSIDAVVITHAHLDHSGLLPLLFKYGYEGPVYCTAPTRDLMSLLQLDYIKVAYGDAKRAPYDSGQIRDSVRYCIPLEYGDTTDITPDIRLTLQNAGHILGSAIAHFHIGEGDHNIAITGDIKYERTWLFNPANDRFPRLETLIIESTYGGYHDVQPSRSASCEQLRIILSETLEKKGKVLIPVFAVGRSQEVMLVIESLMRNKQVPEVPVFIDG